MFDVNALSSTTWIHLYSNKFEIPLNLVALFYGWENRYVMFCLQKGSSCSQAYTISEGMVQLYVYTRVGLLMKTLERELFQIGSFCLTVVVTFDLNRKTSSSTLDTIRDLFWLNYLLVLWMIQWYYVERSDSVWSNVAALLRWLAFSQDAMKIFCMVVDCIRAQPVHHFGASERRKSNFTR